MEEVVRWSSSKGQLVNKEERHGRHWVAASVEPRRGGKQKEQGKGIDLDS
jgi:hypothetical protein